MHARRCAIGRGKRLGWVRVRWVDRLSSLVSKGIGVQPSIYLLEWEWEVGGGGGLNRNSTRIMHDVTRLLGVRKQYCRHPKNSHQTN